MLVTPLPNTVHASDIAPERLAGNTALTDRQKIAEASRQFEAILLRQILAATQKPVIPSKLVDNSTAADIYRDMITNQLADSISKSGGFGLAKTFEQQLTRPEPVAPASYPPFPSPESQRNAVGTTPLPKTQHVDGLTPAGRVPRDPFGSTSSSISELRIRDSRSSSFHDATISKRPSLVNTHE
jgi:flagellar protein FlgJ